MNWNTFSQCKKELYNEYQIEYNEEVRSELKDGCEAICLKMIDKPKNLVKAHIFEYILKNAPLQIHPDEIFADCIHHYDLLGDLRTQWQGEIENTVISGIIEKNKAGRKNKAFTAEADFSHTCPGWERILSLGVSGILEEFEKHSASENLTDEQKVFYESGIITYRAVIAYIKRLSQKAKEKTGEKSLFLAKALDNLSANPPQTMHEAMELTFIFYYLQTFVERVNVRSLGKIDRMYERFYKADIESGRFTEDQIREIIRYFLYRLYALDAIANSPFYLCGTDENGNPFINELSYIFLEEYVGLNIHDPKIHIGYNPKMSKEYLKKVMEAIVSGCNSFVFMNDSVSAKALMSIGINPDDARNYIPVGCYEPCALGKEVPCTCAGRINIPKAVEIAIGKGCELINNEFIGKEIDYEPGSFDEFFRAVKEQLEFSVGRAMEQVHAYEKNFMQINPAPLFSGTLENCVKNGRDAYAGGAKYNNSSLNAFGLANAVDAIVAVKKLVYDEKLLSLSELAKILDNNWEGNEALRLKCQKLLPKYGNNNPEADNIMVELTEFINSLINGKPNGRGGVYRVGYFSIDWYAWFGKFTAALPDGRLCGAALSKNMNAVTGCDKSGVTSLINSVTKLDYTNIPNGTVLDLMLHSSAVEGEDGLEAMLGILAAYMQKGGMALQINVLNPELLKKAQENPENYSTLQVRLCGWNVYFVNLTRAEQDEFIRMSEHTGEVQL